MKPNLAGDRTYRTHVEGGPVVETDSADGGSVPTAWPTWQRMRSGVVDARSSLRENSWLLRRWAFKGGWAVCDQGLTSLASLLIQVMLARWLPAIDYGAFVASYAVLLIVSVVHTGTLCEPMVVFGSGRYSQWFSDYLRVLIRGHFQLTLASAVILAAIAGVLEILGQDEMARALLGAALIGPVLLLWWLARRACNAVSRPHWAAGASAAYFVMVITGASILAVTDSLSVFRAQLILGSSAVLAGLPLLRALLRITAEPMPTEMAAQVRRVHWGYGRWSSASGMMTWLQTQSYYVILPVFAGLEATAALRAVVNLVQPLIQWDFALTGLVLPSLVRARQELSSSFKRRVALASAYFVAEGLTYGTALVMFGQQMMTFAYGGAYSAGVGTLMLLSGVPVLIALCGVFSSALSAAERPERVFRGAAAGGAMVVVGLWAATRWGVEGALVGLLVSSLVQVTLLAYFLSTSARRTASDHAPVSDNRVVDFARSLRP